MIDYQQIIDKYYPASEPALRETLIKHSAQVAGLALEIAKAKRLKLDPEQIKAAAMLHDIGIFLTDAPGINCLGKEPYIRHGILGAELLRKEGAPEWAARVAERHTGAGLDAQEIIDQRLPLPAKDYLPETLLERLICYADKFYSKSGDMQRKPYEKVRASMARFGSRTLARFDALYGEFGLPSSND
ncbi:MAG: HDIG domain-containing protein [Clostridium sp.]|nr:HDIG domain-containing protein [Clostridium sp.]